MRVIARPEPTTRSTRLTALAMAAVLTLAAAPTALAQGVSRQGGAQSEVSVVSAPRMWLPDLRFAPPKAFHVTTPPGKVLLRFTTVLMNAGKGPFVVTGAKDPNDSTRMTTQQWLYDDHGGHVVIDTDAIAKYAGDGHDHWHIQKMQTFELRPADAPGADPLIGFKTGFCFFDGRNINPGRSHNPGSRRYFESGCGNASSYAIKVGLSVGWADTYPWDIANQWIDITDIPSGEYQLCLTADIQGFYTQITRANDQYWVDLTLDMTNKTVTVNASARSACASLGHRE